MKDLSLHPRTSGVMPNTIAVDSSGPQIKDGTPLNASFVNDVWGFMQAALSSGSLTASGAAETSSNSQVLKGIQNVCGAPGEIVCFGQGTVPPGVRLLPLTGQRIVVSQYQALVDNTWPGATHNASVYSFFKCNSSGVRSTTGTHYQLPNFRGQFIRGLSINERSGPDEERNDSGDQYQWRYPGHTQVWKSGRILNQSIDLYPFERSYPVYGQYIEGTPSRVWARTTKFYHNPQEFSFLSNTMGGDGEILPEGMFDLLVAHGTPEGFGLDTLKLNTADPGQKYSTVDNRPSNVTALICIRY
jgi:hypothetical protein